MRTQSFNKAILAGWCFCVLLILTTLKEANSSKDLNLSALTNHSVAKSSHRRGKFFFDELFGLDTGVGLSNDDDDDDDEDGLNNVKTCNCGEYSKGPDI